MCVCLFLHPQKLCVLTYYLNAIIAVGENENVRNAVGKKYTALERELREVERSNVKLREVSYFNLVKKVEVKLREDVVSR